MSERTRTISSMPPKKHTAKTLAPVVARATSLADTLRLLGLPPSGGNYRFIKARVRMFGLDTSHFGLSTLKSRLNMVTDADLRVLAQHSGSIAEILHALELPSEGRPHHELSKRIRALGIDTSHMHGSRWNRGRTAATHPSIARGAQKNSLRNEDVFVENSPVINDGPGLVKRLLALGWVYECKICKIVEWMCKRLVLHLDHINGIANDNRLDNERLLCPNCHSQTETYCNKARPTRASEPPAHYSCYTTVTRACRNW